MAAVDPDFAAVKALFNAVCDQPDPLAALDAANAPAAIAQRVRTLLVLEARQATHFSRPVAQLLQDATQELRPGDRLGAWTLVRHLGHGGMGQVFLAERSDGHYQQYAAIKLLRGWSGDVALAQLARERQILADLQHPHIARLIDGGSTPQGQPYLVMDYLEGERIDHYLASRGIGEVLRLFAQVGSAVAYAHRHLVVHCDLKPANVLVDADGRAMLLDFGIAQLQGVDAGAELQAMTPRYASPEQRAGRPASAASDIFSLGAMLAELLEAARAPRAREWRAVVARACAAEPERRYPSVDALLDDLERYRRHAPVRALPPSPAYVGAKWLRRRWPWALAGTGALAMAGGFTVQLVQQRDRAVVAEVRAQQSAAQAEREAERARAQTRLAIAAQGQLREQRDRADQARTEAQRARNLATRERDLARSAERREQAQRATAEQEVQTTREVSDFLVSLFDAADLRRGGRADLPVSQLVDKGTEQLDQKLADRPALRGRLQGVLARVQGNMGHPEVARRLYEQAIAQERVNPRPDRVREATLLAELAVLLANLNQPGPSVQAAREALALRLAHQPADAPAQAEAWNTLGLALRSAEAFEEARQAYSRSLALRERAGVEPSLEVASTLHNMGLLERATGQLGQAEVLLRRAAAIKTRWLPEGHQDRINTDNMLAALIGQRGRPHEALAMYQRLLEQQRRNAGDQSPRVADLQSELAFILHDLNRYAEAIAHYEEALAVVTRLAPAGYLHARLLNNLAAVLADQGHPDAGARYEESLAIRRATAAAEAPQVRRAELNLGRWLVRQGQTERGQALLHAAEAGALKRLPPEHQDRVAIQTMLAHADLQAGRVDAAAERAAGLQSVESRMRPPVHAQWLSLRGLIASAQGRPREALERQREALAALDRQAVGVSALQLRLRVEWALAAAAAGEPEAVRQLWPQLRAQMAEQHAASPLRQRLAPLAETLGLTKP